MSVSTTSLGLTPLFRASFATRFFSVTRNCASMAGSQADKPIGPAAGSSGVVAAEAPAEAGEPDTSSARRYDSAYASGSAAISERTSFFLLVDIFSHSSRLMYHGRVLPARTRSKPYLPGGGPRRL